MNKIKLTYTQIIALSFLLLILLGSLLLSLPVSSRSGNWTNYGDALFTATSASCVTGLVVYDTYTHWSLIGQLVIITLIQIGGLGVMTIISSFFMVSRHNFSLHERKLIMESTGNLRVGGVVKLLKKVITYTFIFESIGAIILSIRFIPEMGVVNGIYNGIFHAVSAFCNAGFDILGKNGEFTSLTTYVSDPVVSPVIAFLIIFGGIGFYSLNDIYHNRFRFKKFELHTKIVLLTTAFLLVLGTILFLIFERDNTLNELSVKSKFIASFFHSTTPRTAGFNSLDMASLSQSSQILTVILMFIGGSPGSTAGGIKTTTFAALTMCVISSIKNNSNIVIFKKRLDDSVIKIASTVSSVYITLILISGMILCYFENISVGQSIFEVVSAIGTVGLTLGITPSLHLVSKVVLIILMYCGRIGGFTLMLAFTHRKQTVPLDRPVEKILIG